MKLFISAILIILCLTTRAQGIKQMEYFFDTDPGTGKAIPLTITASDTVNITADIAINNIATGLHVLYIRVKNDAGWGDTENFLFTVSDSSAAGISAAEYFIDTDPGVGKGKKLVVTTLTDTLKRTYNIPTAAGLDPAINHYICIRTKNEKGIWSLYALDTFKVTPGFAPVALKLNAQKNNNIVSIDWHSNDMDAASYSVEKSINGIDFTEIDNIRSANAAQAYLSKDMHPVNGINFYRIKQVNAEGEISYSNIAKTLFDINVSDVLVYPNPAKDVVKIMISSGDKIMFVNVFDATGRWVKMYKVSAETKMQLNVSDLAKGTYILQISNGEKIYKSKLLKQ